MVTLQSEARVKWGEYLEILLATLIDNHCQILFIFNRRMLAVKEGKYLQ